MQGIADHCELGKVFTFWRERCCLKYKYNKHNVLCATCRMLWAPVQFWNVKIRKYAGCNVHTRDKPRTFMHSTERGNQEILFLVSFQGLYAHSVRQKCPTLWSHPLYKELELLSHNKYWRPINAYKILFCNLTIRAQCRNKWICTGPADLEWTNFSWTIYHVLFKNHRCKRQTPDSTWQTWVSAANALLIFTDLNPLSSL